MAEPNVDYQGMDLPAPDRAVALTLGMGDEEHVDASSSNATPAMQNCRGFHVDVDGIIKFTFNRPLDGQSMTKVMTAKAGQIYAQRNITTIYNKYDGSNACTATAYNTAGVLKIGMHLFR